jgi:hypothetical protein
MKAIVILDLRDLERGIPALTEALGQVHAQSAAICVEQGNHREPVNLSVKKIKDRQHVLRWPDVNETMRRAFNDLERATELAACGVAILLLRDLTGLTAIRQSRKGTGFDYWLGPVETGDELAFQNTARLEVSGILSGTASQMTARLKQKLKQTEASDKTRLPAYALVVEFGRPQAEVQKR